MTKCDLYLLCIQLSNQKQDLKKNNLNYSVLQYAPWQAICIFIFNIYSLIITSIFCHLGVSSFKRLSQFNCKHSDSLIRLLKAIYVNMPHQIKIFIDIYYMHLKGIIDERIGLGKYQILTFLVLSLVGTNDGVQMILSSLLNPIIKSLYPQLTTSMISLLASIFFIGVIFGSLTSGQLADKYGRLTLIQSGAVIQIIAGLLFYFSNSLVLIYVLRFTYGYAFGFCNSTITSMFIEVSPTKYRGKGLILLNFCITFGKLYGLLLGYLFIKEDITKTDWKTMMFCGGAPSILVIIGCIFFLYESPRFLLTHQRFQQAYVVLDQISKVNHGSDAVLLSEEDKMEIKDQFHEVASQKDETSYLVLFENHNLKKTISLMAIWIIINFCFYGQLTIEGLHISKGSQSPTDLKNYMLTVLGQLPSFIISLLLIDRVQFGRKYSILLFFLGGSAFHLSFAITSIVFMGSIARFFMKDVFQIIDPLTTESYETKIRIKGYGFCAASSRLGAVLMPYIAIPLDAWNQQSVYYVFSGLMLIASLIVWRSVQETMNRNLESKDKNEFTQLKEEKYDQ